MKTPRGLGGFGSTGTGRNRRAGQCICTAKHLAICRCVMPVLPRKGVLAITAVIDIAVNARGRPVAAKVLAGRHGLPARHLEPVLQALVRHGILKGRPRSPRWLRARARAAPHQCRRHLARDRQRRRVQRHILCGIPICSAEWWCPPWSRSRTALSAALARINVEELAHCAAGLEKSAEK